MSETEIIKKVRDILNEHGGDDAVSIATDRVLLETYIKSAIPDAVVMLAQKGYAVNVGTKIFTVSGMAETAVEGFVSFLEARSSGWRKVITALTPTDSPEYKMAQNTYTAPLFIAFARRRSAHQPPDGKSLSRTDYHTIQRRNSKPQVRYLVMLQIHVNILQFA